MSGGSRAVHIVALVLMMPLGVRAQDAQERECARITGQDVGDESCFFLAGTLVGEIGAGMILGESPALTLRDLQPAQEGSSSAAGSLAQSDAVPAARPMAIGGGSVSAVGSDAGADAITALTLNPSVFFPTGRSGEKVARNSRLADMTLFFPVDNLDRDDDGAIDYFGFQMRVNFTGLSSGNEVWAAAERLRDLTVIETDETERLTAALRQMPVRQIQGCVEQLGESSATAERVVAACGSDLRPDLDAPTYEEFRESLMAAKEQADSKYFGLDVRMDIGDPTLGAVADAEAVSINGGVALGRQFVGEDPMSPSAGIRLRAGLRYTDVKNLDETSFAFDGGLGFVLRSRVDVEKALSLSAGFEARYGGVDESLKGAMQTDFVMFKAALSVPVTDQVAITLSLGQPLVGEEVSRTLSVTGDWRLLLPMVGAVE